MLTLAQYMRRHDLSVLAVAKRAGVSWRSVRDAARGRLRTTSTARQIAAALDPAVVDVVSMLDVREERSA